MVDSWKEQPAILRAGRKTPEVNNILKISTSCQEISFLSNFSILLGPTDLVELSEDIMRAISSLSVGLKKIILRSIFQKVWKVFTRIFNIYFTLRSNGRKIIVENISNLNWVMIVLLFAFRIFGISDGLGLILNIDFIPLSIFIIVPINIKKVVIIICFISFQKDR